MGGAYIGIYIYGRVYEDKISLNLRLPRDIFHRFEKAQRWKSQGLEIE